MQNSITSGNSTGIGAGTSLTESSATGIEKIVARQAGELLQEVKF